MGVFNNFSNIISRMGQDTRVAIDLRNLVKRIKSYETEERSSYSELGRLFYQHRKAETQISEKRVSELVENIDNLRFRINQLGKQYDDKKKRSLEQSIDNQKEAQKDAPRAVEHEAPALQKSENDIRIKRTPSGITLVRICPGCGIENQASSEACGNCQAKLSNRS